MKPKQVPEYDPDNTIRTMRVLSEMLPDSRTLMDIFLIRIQRASREGLTEQKKADLLEESRAAYDGILKLIEYRGERHWINVCMWEIAANVAMVALNSDEILKTCAETTYRARKFDHVRKNPSEEKYLHTAGWRKMLTFSS